jgi:DNA-binding phage protein
MSTLEVTADLVVHAAQVASKMKASGLPDTFIAGALKLSQESRGAYELMVMWQDAENSHERDEIIADIQELLDDAHTHPSQPIKKPYLKFSELENVVNRVLVAKQRVRELIDRHGGVCKVAELSGIPQPSLSRMLNSASMPRRTTLYRIAEALNISETKEYEHVRR